MSFDQPTQPYLPPVNGIGSTAANVPATYVPAYPPEAFQVPTVPPRRSAGFWVAVTAATALGMIAVLLAGFFVGRGTRLSNNDVQGKVTQQQLGDQIAQQQSLSAQKAADQKVMDTVVSQAQRKGEAAGLSQGRVQGQQQGFRQGQQQGYQQGQTAGQSQGFQQGQQQGFNQGQSSGYSQGFNSGLCVSANLIC